MSDQDTRDIAVAAETKIDQHMTDCTSFRVTISNTLAEFRADIKQLNWRVALIVGSLTILGKVWDALIPHIH